MDAATFKAAKEVMDRADSLVKRIECCNLLHDMLDGSDSGHEADFTIQFRHDRIHIQNSQASIFNCDKSTRMELRGMLSRAVYGELNLAKNELADMKLPIPDSVITMDAAMKNLSADEKNKIMDIVMVGLGRGIHA